jgi:hypothetical protein
MSRFEYDARVKVSGFTFLRNGQKLGYPFVQSIQSVLPIVDEMVIALGPCDDQTEPMLTAIGSPKLRIIHTTWNEHMRNDRRPGGYVYGAQKSIALFNCTGDWAFYLEADEVLHENDLPGIQTCMERHLNNPGVEALVFNYIHFYGNKNTYAWSPRWYRCAPRILRNNIPAFCPDGLFFVVLKDHKHGRYPFAAHTGATIYHYGWVRSEEQMNLKSDANEKHWSNKTIHYRYRDVDPQTLRPFTGTHPRVVQNWLPPADGLFQADPSHLLTKRERRHRVMMKLENSFGWELTKKHYRLVK